MKDMSPIGGPPAPVAPANTQPAAPRVIIEESSMVIINRENGDNNPPTSADVRLGDQNYHVTPGPNGTTTISPPPPDDATKLQIRQQLQDTQVELMSRMVDDIGSPDGTANDANMQTVNFLDRMVDGIHMGTSDSVAPSTTGVTAAAPFDPGDGCFGTASRRPIR